VSGLWMLTFHFSDFYLEMHSILVGEFMAVLNCWSSELLVLNCCPELLSTVSVNVDLHPSCNDRSSRFRSCPEPSNASLCRCSIPCCSRAG